MNLPLSRRSVLKRAAALSAGLLVPPFASRRVGLAQDSRSPNETLIVAAIGTGNMGRVNIRSAHASGAKIVALCDVDDKQLAPLEKDFPSATQYKDYRRLFEREKNIDAVIISTPDHAHAVIAAAAMQLGKHIYCEKPLARTVYEVRKMMEIAREQKVVTQLGNQGHSFHSIGEFRECIESGVIGAVKEVHAVQAAFSNSRIDQLPRLKERPAVPESLDWNLWLGPVPERPYHPMFHPGAWRGWRPFGTGSFGDFACHILDPVAWTLNLKAPVSVQAEAEGYDPKLHHLTFPRSSKIRFEFPGEGKRPAVTLYWYDGFRYKPPHSDELLGGDESVPVPGREGGTKIGALVVGEKGFIVYGSHGAKEWHIYPRAKMEEYLKGRKRVPESPSFGPPGNLKHVGEWLGACRGDNQTGSDFDYGGPLTEIALLGNIALLMPGEELQWDAKHMTFPNRPEANQYLHFAYRDGWTL